MNKTITKAVSKESQLHVKLRNLKKHKIKRNLIKEIKLLCVAEKSFFTNLFKKSDGSRNFCKTLKHLFSEKLVWKEIINLIENEKTLINNKDIDDKISSRDYQESCRDRRK